MSKLFAKPVNAINKVVKMLSQQLKKGHVLNRSKIDKVLELSGVRKYVMYSAHDHEIAQAWQFLSPYKFNWFKIPFASFL